MKEATATIKLSKEHEVIRHGITPIEAMLLCAEHHLNVGACPVEIHEKTVKDIVVDTGTLKDGKPVTRTRTTDEELDRLRERYANNKVDTLLTKVRDFPEDFAKALERGIKISLPSNKMAEIKVL